MQRIHCDMAPPFGQVSALSRYRSAEDAFVGQPSADESDARRVCARAAGPNGPPSGIQGALALAACLGQVDLGQQLSLIHI